MSFDIAKLARNFDDITNALRPMRTLTAPDQEILRMRLDDMRRFLAACEAHSTEIEQLLNWVLTLRGVTPHGSRDA
jgi:hypothetical protein